MKFRVIPLLFSSLIFAEDQIEFSLTCFDKSQNQYQITLDMDKKKFRIKEEEIVISEGLIAKINNSKNDIDFQLLEIENKDKKLIFKNKNILGKLTCNV